MPPLLLVATSSRKVGFVVPIPTLPPFGFRNREYFIERSPLFVACSHAPDAVPKPISKTPAPLDWEKRAIPVCTAPDVAGDANVPMISPRNPGLDVPIPTRP